MLRQILLFVALTALVSCQGQQARDVKETRFLLGTIVDFTVHHQDEALALKAIQQAAAEMQRVEAAFTTHGSDANTVQLFNQAHAGEKVVLDSAVEQLLLQSIAIQKQTYGAFDPTLGDLNRLWGFSNDVKPVRPLSEAVVRAALENSGIENIQQLKPLLWLKKKEGLKLDFGAIAKGLAIDKGIAVLERMGMKHAIINAGGDIRVIGDHGGKPWKIAVRAPRSSEPLGWFAVDKPVSIVTSGDYERFFMADGKRYHHILNPSTGYPARASMSVTVSAPTAAQADALSTAMFVLGYDKGLAIIEDLADVEAVWVDADQSVHMSSGMKVWFNSVDLKQEPRH